MYTDYMNQLIAGDVSSCLSINQKGSDENVAPIIDHHYLYVIKSLSKQERKRGDVVQASELGPRNPKWKGPYTDPLTIHGFTWAWKFKTYGPLRSLATSCPMEACMALVIYFFNFYHFFNVTAHAFWYSSVKRTSEIISNIQYLKEKNCRHSLFVHPWREQAKNFTLFSPILSSQSLAMFRDMSLGRVEIWNAELLEKLTGAGLFNKWFKDKNDNYYVLEINFWLEFCKSIFRP